MIKQAKSSPDIENYFCFLISLAGQTTLGLSQEGLHAARSAAAIILKNDIKSHYKDIPPDSKAYVQSTILQGLNDTNPQIRNVSGNVITELVRQGGIMSCPDILPSLLSLIGNESGSTSQSTQEGASNALLKVCEDNRKALSKTYRSQCPLDVLMPKLLSFTAHSSAKIRATSLSSINVFILEKYGPVMQHLDSLMSRIFDLANDSNDDVRKHVCRAIVHIAEVSPERIAPHMSGLVDYMVSQQRNVDDPELALDAAEFFLFISEEKNLRQALGPCLPKIVPVLLESMVYSEDDVLRLEDEAEDAEIEDREQDIKPRFAASKANRATAGGNGTGAPNGYSYGNDDLSEGELEEYDEGDEDDDPESQWNLRKCSAAALDVLAGVFQKEVFETTLPYLKDNLTHSEWPNREAAVLTIGAIADGCMPIVEPHLPDLIPFLVSLLSDTQPIVRQITCWSLGRYSAWASHLDEAGKERFFLPMMDGILKRMLDRNKRVQEAAASAFANLEEKANTQLQNPAYCEVIARQFAECFAKYKDRNMFILYDCVQTLAEHVGPSLQNSELVHTLMPPLLARWEKVSDQSQEMFPLLECLSYVATSLGNTFTPYAVPIFHRCIKIIYQNLQVSLTAAQHQDLEGGPDQDFLVTSLDLLSAIVQALGEEKSTKLVAESEPSMFELLHFCLENANSDVRQSAYALLGDCAIYIFFTLQPYLPKIMPILITQLDLSDSSASNGTAPYAVTNNACWSCGEIAMRAGSSLDTYVETLLDRMYTVLRSDKLLSLRENAAIAMGRLGNCAADKLAPHLASFAPLLLQHMKRIHPTDEKVQAMRGLAEVARRNPQGLEMCLLDFLAELASLKSDQPAMLSQEDTATFQNVSESFELAGGEKAY